MQDVEQLNYLQYLLSKLTPRQRQFIIDKHLMGFTANEMLSKMGVSGKQSYIHRTNKNIIGRLQKFDLEHRRIYGVRSA